LKINIWELDVGDQDKIINTSTTYGFVVDCPDRDRMDEGKQELHRIINHTEMTDAISFGLQAIGAGPLIFFYMVSLIVYLLGVFLVCIRSRDPVKYLSKYLTVCNFYAHFFFAG